MREGLQRLETMLSAADRTQPLVVARLAIALALLAVNTYRSTLAFETGTVAVAMRSRGRRTVHAGGSVAHVCRRRVTTAAI